MAGRHPPLRESDPADRSPPGFCLSRSTVPASLAPAAAVEGPAAVGGPGGPGGPGASAAPVASRAPAASRSCRYSFVMGGLHPPSCGQDGALSNGGGAGLLLLLANVALDVADGALGLADLLPQLALGLLGTVTGDLALDLFRLATNLVVHEDLLGNCFCYNNVGVERLERGPALCGGQYFAPTLGRNCSIELVHPSLPVAEALAKPLRLGDHHRHIGQLDLASRLG